MPQATTSGTAAEAARSSDQIQAALQLVTGSITQAKAHERLLRRAGIRLDRAGASLLYKLHLSGEPLRVTDLAEMLGVDTPTVTRKIQQLEREKLVTRQADSYDRRATRISLTAAGRNTLEKILKARLEWLDGLVADWDQADRTDFARLLAKFAAVLQDDSEDPRDD
jgi:DNA-binding MarR family transcriptional regulator